MRQQTKKTFNFFDRVNVTTGDFGDCAVSWDFISSGILLLNEGTAGNVVQYSFDGISVHGDLNPSLASAGIGFDERHQCKIYFRLSSGSGALVRVEAWA